MYLRVCVLALLSVSASMRHSPPPSKFCFISSQYRRVDSCNICYGNECLPFEQDRCDYYSETNNLLQNEDEDLELFENSQLREDVDSLMFDIVEKAAVVRGLECIPFLSRYTDCDKETVCIGCKTCQCDSTGKWNCVSTSDCRAPEPAIEINHQDLVTIIENLLNGAKLRRRKRSKNLSRRDKPVIKPEEIADWFFGINPSEEPSVYKETIAPQYVLLGQNNRLDTTKNEPLTEHNFESTITVSTITTESDYLAFDDVLKAMSIEHKNYTRRKLPPKPIESESIDFDYMLSENYAISQQDNNTQNNSSEKIKFDNITLIENEITKPFLESATKVVIDLLQPVKENILFNDTDYVDMIGSKNDLFNIVNTNSIFDNNAINLIKREIPSVLITTEESNTTNTMTKNSLNVSVDNVTEIMLNKPSLKNNVLLPLIKIIKNNEKQVDELQEIKKHLVTFMKSINQSPVVEILDYPNISETNTLHDIEMFPDLAYNFRRSDINILQKFLHKLKFDIYEVAKDISNIKKIDQTEIPENLATLIESLERYVHKDKPLIDTAKSDELNKNYTNFTRRRLEQKVNKCPETTFRQCIIEVLQTIDKDVPIDNAVAALSVFSRRIIKNIVRTYRTRNFSGVGFIVRDPNYNMTSELATIGSKWQDMTNNIIGKSPLILLYKMKLVHLFLQMDINKMENALTIIQFAQNRRFVPFFKNVPNNVIDSINGVVKSIYDKFRVIVDYYSKNPNNKRNTLTFGSLFEETDAYTTIVPVSKEQRKTKHSFMKHIRNLLKSSKGEIYKINEKLPKSEIVKQLALKKLSNIAQKRYLEYEQAMRRWQNTLGVAPRTKRDLLERLKGRIKNIIPKYLRHKVNPKLNEKKMGGINQRDFKIGKKNGHKKHRLTTLTTATTPKTKPTTRQTKTTAKSHKTSGIAAKIRNKTPSVIKRLRKLGNH